MRNLMQWKMDRPTVFSNIQNSFLSLQNELDKTLKDFCTIFDITKSSSKVMSNLNISPSVDIVEDDKTFKVEIEMPGIAEEDIKVSVKTGSLILKGQKKTSRKDEGKNYLMREIGYGYYEREIPLPEDLDIDNAKASFRKGMLWINIPKKEGSERQSKELKIEKA